MQAIIYILATLVLLGLCVFVHELGHLLGGRLVGIKARTFSVGFGHGILKKEINGTTYQIAPIPLGGYCSFYGESATEAREGKSYEFLTAAPWRRIVTVAAGPFFNLIFGVVLFFVMNVSGYVAETNRILIPEYVKSGNYVAPAFSAGLQNGDRIVSINGKTIHTFVDIQTAVMFSNGKTLAVDAERNGEHKNFTVVPTKFSAKDPFTIGILPYGTKVQVAGVMENEPASKAGLKEMDEILSINGEPVTGPEKFVSVVRASSGKKLDFLVSRNGKQMTLSVTPRLREMLSVENAEQPRTGKEKVSVITDNMQAVKAGIEKGTVSFNGTTVKNYDQLVSLVKGSEGKVSTLVNANSSYKGLVKYESAGFVGIEPALAHEMLTVRYGFGEAFIKALVDPYDFIVVNIKGLGMLASGKLNVRESVSGPIRIGKIAGDTAYYKGISAFIVLMAKISIILMIMNLLPIPAIDGSFLVFFAIEWIIGRPLKEKVMEKIQMIGFAFIVLLSVFVIFNDLASFSFFQKILGFFK